MVPDDACICSDGAHVGSEMLAEGRRGLQTVAQILLDGERDMREIRDLADILERYARLGQRLR